MIDLSGKTFVIIGATGDIGGNLARYLHSMGANIVAVGRNTSKLMELDSLKPRMRTLEIGSEDLIDDMEVVFDHGLAAFGKFDALITSVGQWVQIDVSEEPEKFIDQLDKDFAAFVRPSVAPMFVFNKYFKENGGGLMVDISSHAAEGNLPGNLTYAPAKAAVKSFIENLRAENGPDSKVVVARAISQLVDTAKNRANPRLVHLSEEDWQKTVQIKDMAEWIISCIDNPKAELDKLFKSGIVL